MFQDDQLVDCSIKGDLMNVLQYVTDEMKCQHSCTELVKGCTYFVYDRSKRNCELYSRATEDDVNQLSNCLFLVGSPPNTTV